MTLFVGVLWPLTRFLVRIAGTDRAADTMTGAYLARERMEALRRSPESAAPDTLTINERTLYVRPEVIETDSLTTMIVRVYRGDEDAPLVQLTTRVAPTSSP